ncbi:MAG: PQQ-like beta-propeller repeat protein [Thermoplasmatales archaeon]|nr:MAG: PQQ-like beta-propeller repeat protein [Thermoplasmatales archaeon]
MKKKIIGIFICMLLIATAIPVVGINNSFSKDEHINFMKIQTSSSNVDWWPMAKHDLRHSGFSTSQAPNQAHLLWTYDTGYLVYSQPVVVDDKAYFGSMSDKLYCANASTGEHIWEFQTDHWVMSSPSVVNNKVYFTSEDDNLYCLNAENGSLIWKFASPFGDADGCPAVYEGEIYIGIDGGYPEGGAVHCLDAEDGSIKWTYKTSEESCSSPAIYNGKLYIGSAKKSKSGSYGATYVYCLDAKSGTLMWKKYTSHNKFHIAPSVVVEDDKLYVSVTGIRKGKVYCLDVENGKKIWSFSPLFIDIFPSICLSAAYGKIYVSFAIYDKVNNHYCLDAETGKRVWTFKGYSGPPSIADGKVYFGTAKGQGEWEGNVFCLNAHDGEIVWQYYVGQNIYSVPSIADGKLFIGTCENKVYCFGDPSNRPEAPLVLGPSSGNVREEHTYTASTTDADSDDIYYMFDWDDGTDSGWLGPFSSGEEVAVNHSWSWSGEYKIRVKAKDVHGAVSNWGILEVSMPKSLNMWFNGLLDRFPMLHRFLGLIWD